MKKLILSVLLSISAFLFSISPVFAVNFTLSEVSVSSDTINFNVKLSDVTGANCPDGKCYLQGAIQKSSGDPHFGFTKNNADQWIAYTSEPDPGYIKANFLYCTVTGSTCETAASVRFNQDDPDYKGAGTYTLKMLRFTGESKSNAGDDATASVELTLAAVTPSPSPTATPSPTPTPTATATPTATPTPKPTQKSQATNKPAAVMGEKITSPSPLIGVEELRGDLKQEEEINVASVSGSLDESRGTPALAYFFIAGGAVFLGGAAFPFLKPYLSRYNKNSRPIKHGQSSQPDNQGSPFA